MGDSKPPFQFSLKACLALVAMVSVFLGAIRPVVAIGASARWLLAIAVAAIVMLGAVVRLAVIESRQPLRGNRVLFFGTLIYAAVMPLLLMTTIFDQSGQAILMIAIPPVVVFGLFVMAGQPSGDAVFAALLFMAAAMVFQFSLFLGLASATNELR